MDIKLDEAITLLQFFSDGAKNKQVKPLLNMDNMQYLLKELYINNHENIIRQGDIIIELGAGFYGNMTTRTVDEIKEPKLLTAKEGDYDFISITTHNENTTLWTDNSTIQPFNRQSPFYVPFGWQALNKIKETETYREFHIKTSSNISFGMWAFHYNPFWKMVRMGMCVKADKFEYVISEIRRILQKP